MYDPSMSDQIDQVRRYRAPRPDQVERMERLRTAVTDVMVLVDGLCPHSREKSLAVARLDEALFYANSAMIRNE